MTLEIYKPENPGYEEFNFSQLLEKSQEVIGREARVELSDGEQFGIHPIDSVQEDGIYFKSDHKSKAVKFFVSSNQIEKVIIKS
ncbi:MAG: hypothetical protein V1867_04135 [Candidatus Falkowbacteria bacterium]